MKTFLLVFLFATFTSQSWAQVKVVFTVISMPAIPASSPKSLFLAGNFNDWKPADNKWILPCGNVERYTITQYLSPGDYEFKVTRGSWTMVECGLQGAFFENRRLHIKNDTSVNITIAEWKDNYPLGVKKHTASKQVHVIDTKFLIPQLGRQRKIWIYLPKDYKASHKKYPVIYMHDGQNLFDEAAGNSGEWGIDEFLDKIKPRKEQAIVVGIDHGGQYRLTEYNPYDSEYGKGVGEGYAKFLVKTLKPYIDAHYHTRKNAKNTTVAGSSMGGLISMYAALTYPKTFGNAGVFSPSFWIAPDIYTYAKQKALKKSRFYFVCGDQESAKEIEDVNKMVAILAEKGLPKKNIPSTVIKDGRHNEQQWRADFPDFYKWLTIGK